MTLVSLCKKHFDGELEKHFDRVIKVGDEAHPNRILEAMRSGYEAARDLQL